MTIGSTSMKQVCLAVWDIDKAEKCWTHILGIEPERRKTPLWKNVPSYTHDKPDVFVEQDFIVYRLADGLALEIFGPGNDGQPNPWREFLEKHGEGVCNLAFYVPDRAEAYNAIGEVCKANRPYHEGFYPGGTYTFVDTYAELGVELNIKKDEDNNGLISQLEKDPASYTNKPLK
jgi:methylmalonyl-CoA/ethylmalonyl-CoA epimerase